MLSDLVRDIRDPEKPSTLEQLDIVYEHGVTVTGSDPARVYLEFKPTVPHCSLATLIGGSRVTALGPYSRTRHVANFRNSHVRRC